MTSRPGFVKYFAIFAEGLEHRLLVRAHETSIPLDIGGEDRGQLARDFLFRHALTLRNSAGGDVSVMLTPSLLSCSTSALGQNRKSSVGLGMSGVGGGAEVDFGRLEVRS